MVVAQFLDCPWCQSMFENSRIWAPTNVCITLPLSAFSVALAFETSAVIVPLLTESYSVSTQSSCQTLHANNVVEIFLVFKTHRRESLAFVKS